MKLQPFRKSFFLAPESYTFHAVSELITKQKTWKLQDTLLWKYDIASNPALTGRSIHNQRIERLWKDVFTYVLQHDYTLYFLESISKESTGLLTTSPHYRIITPFELKGTRVHYNCVLQVFYQFAKSEYTAP